MRKIVSTLVFGLPLSLVFLAVFSGFFATLILDGSCPDEVRGFDDSKIYVNNFSVEDENQLILNIVNDAEEEISLQEIRLFTFSSNSEKITLKHSIESNDETQIQINLDKSNNCNDIPFEIEYETSTGIKTGEASISAYVK